MPRSERAIQLTPTVTQSLHEISDVIPLYLHVVRGSEGAAIIDAGLPQSASILDALIADGAGEVPLRYLCNTHPHHDHIGNLRRLRAAQGALVVAAEAGRSWIEDADRNLREFALHHPDILGPTAELLEELEPTFDGGSQVDVLVHDGITLNLGGGVELEAFRVDGHLHAELAWFESSSRCLLLGDVVTATAWPIFHGHVDPEKLRNSLNRLTCFVVERDVQTVAMSHYSARPAHDFLALVAEVRSDVDRIEALVLDNTRAQPRGLEEIWRGVCADAGKEPEFRALAMVDAHLQRMVADGRVRRVAPETYTSAPTRSDAT